MGEQKALDTHAWIARLRAAQYNTFEAVQCMLCSFFVASSLEHGKDLAVSKLLFAKIATLFLCVRLLYPVCYVLDLDLFRTPALSSSTSGFHRCSLRPTLLSLRGASHPSRSRQWSSSRFPWRRCPTLSRRSCHSSPFSAPSSALRPPRQSGRMASSAEPKPPRAEGFGYACVDRPPPGGAVQHV